MTPRSRCSYLAAQEIATPTTNSISFLPSTVPARYVRVPTQEIHIR